LLYSRRYAGHCRRQPFARTDNDRVFASDLIQLFVVSTSETIAQLERAIGDDADCEIIRKLAHSIKGSAATAAAAALAAAAADLERVAGSRHQAAALSALHATFALTTAEWARLGWMPAARAERA
jgi:HPt (histidine-containing phosphotransfer) domain-containing protein